MHGMGVNTPQAAEVADATVGFVTDLHIPKGSMFTMGAKSVMVALGFPCIRGRKKSVIMSFDGVVPKEHCIVAPMQTYLGIVFYYLSSITFSINLLIIERRLIFVFFPLLLFLLSVLLMLLSELFP